MLIGILAIIMIFMALALIFLLGTAIIFTIASLMINISELLKRNNNKK